MSYNRVIWAIHLEKIMEPDGIHTVGFYTDRANAEAALARHNANHPGYPAHLWDYPANELLSDNWTRIVLPKPPT